MRYGRWEVVKELGSGGQGTTYLVRDTRAVDLDAVLKSLQNAINTLRTIQPEPRLKESAHALMQSVEAYLSREAPQNLAALKVLHDRARQDQKALGRLRNEIHILRQIDHPNIVKVVDASRGEGLFAMPFYPGGTLAEHRDLFKGDPVRALTVFRTLLGAVATLHSLPTPVVHRDIKPENVFLSGENLVLGDFGIVYFADPGHTRLSDTYEKVGSTNWMPGWAISRRIDEIKPSFDVFCLGKLLWAMVSGRTLLPLWYFKEEDEFNLEKLFPNDERMPWVNRLLQGSVVQHERDCWNSATEMLRNVDEVLGILRRGGQVVHRQVKRYCLVCGVGQYQRIAEGSGGVLRDYGMNLTGVVYQMFTCVECGHVQLFRMDQNPPSWR